MEPALCSADLTRRIFLGAAMSASLFLPAKAVPGMSNVVLLGDSVFDNAAYVGSDPDVVAQLRSTLAGSGTATLLARDGAVTAGVLDQLTRLPDDATHLVVSTGGNDALRESSLLQARAGSVAEILTRIADIRDRFRRDYRAMLAALKDTGLPVLVATIYDPRFSEPLQRQLSTTALSFINDVILREAFAHGVDVLDLRLVCSDDADFANAIEPSSRGGEKMAAAIATYASGLPPAGSQVLIR
jgi:hypothetical protein